MSRWAWADVDLDSIRRNVEVLCAVAAPARLWAVVKADGYGHGAIAVAGAALDGGATGLCVALVQEGVALREAGFDCPILVLSAQPASELPAAIRAALDLTVYSGEQLAEIASAGGTRHPVHLKIDTGMRRVGASTSEAIEIASAIVESPAVRFAGVCTHLAIADEPDDPFTAAQLETFERVLDAAATDGDDIPMVHAANSAATLAFPAARFDMVRVGIAIYGISPGPALDEMCSSLEPALSLRARVSHVKRVDPGDRISYGLRHTFRRSATVATLPLGYADGVSRRLFVAGGEVLLGGVRRPIVGVVTMDQMMVDCGDDAVAVGDEAVLIGRQGGEVITANELGQRLGTIGYEVVCGISSRIERRYTRG
ncbi:MAG TPA: alanine racemase [Ilumatobacteraceae bacterium]